MRIGFSGTRDGMSVRQWLAVCHWLKRAALDGVEECHHGACVGADAEFILALLEHAYAEIHAHPSNLKGMTDSRALEDSDVVHDPLPPLDRNRVIVESSDVLLATPKGTEKEFFKSGTWASVRYARKAGKRVVIVWRDGTLTQEG